MTVAEATEALTTWIRLNSVMLKTDEEDCRLLLRLEMEGKQRKQFLLRIHSRLNKVRAHKERKGLIEK